MSWKPASLDLKKRFRLFEQIERLRLRLHPLVELPATQVLQIPHGK
jgi:hypothetical protein